MSPAVCKRAGGVRGAHHRDTASVTTAGSSRMESGGAGMGASAVREPTAAASSPICDEITRGS